MKPAASTVIAGWLLEHFTFGLDSEALAGDLREELQSGRSANWYRRQVVAAIAVGVIKKSRDYALPLLFSIAWSIFYPAWQLCLAPARLIQLMPERWTAIDWPYSTALHGIGELTPAVLFLWLGLFVYLMLRTERASGFSSLRLLAGLSISLNIFLITAIALWIHLKPSGMGLGDMANKNLLLNSHLAAICIALAAGLFSAIASVLPLPHRRGSAPLPG
ncbi:MAG TPA: hypothetical protein VGU67_02205 [Edaphobacter sp.]|nr:hypothetical protein [Edaphobacter sp.]